MMEKIKINFILKINGVEIKFYKKTYSGYIFNVDGKKMNMRQITANCSIDVVCGECGSNIHHNTLQNLIKLNKIFLCRSCRNFGDKNGMYGKKHSEETRKLLSIAHLGEKNYFYGKHHSEEAKLKQSKRMIGKYVGENNPMYGKSIFDVWVEKYGIEEAKRLTNDRSKQLSESMTGENNPMYGKSIFDVWVEKYGIEEATNKYNKMIENASVNMKLLYDSKPEIKIKISEKLKGRTFSDKHKENLRLSSINFTNKKLELTGNKMVPHFNVSACYFLDEVSKIKNVNIQHALNGGEFFIKELGYWVDGYDKDNNVVYEFYENDHKFKKEKDLIREEKIRNHLNCEFIIINEGEEIDFINKLK